MAAGLAADVLFGDPRRLHPVAGFGRVANVYEARIWRPRRLAGVLYALSLVGATTVAAARAEKSASTSQRFALRALFVWASLGGRSLWREATLMAQALEAGDLAAARQRAPNLVGRDPGELDSSELCRATVESVAENTSDAIVAPLVWTALAGAGGCAGYRAANTLDAMVGHRSARYREFGWAAARVDDLVNWPAARLTAGLAVLTAPFVGGDRASAWRVVRRDGRAHPSPNAGRVEAAFAGALAVRLGGQNRYHGEVEERPTLGSGQAPTHDDIARAVRLSQLVTVAAAALTVATSGRR
jgi:adenosylcobinamide-phosphate synthase